MTAKMIRRALGLATVLTVGASLAGASTIYLPPQILPFGTIIAGGSATVFFDKFDTTSIVVPPNQQAVLTSVAIGLQSNNTGTIQMVNFNATDRTVAGATSTLPLTLTAVNLNFNTNAVADTCGAFTTPNPGSCVNSMGGVGGVALPFGTPGLDLYGVIPNAANTIAGVTGTTSSSSLVAGPLAFYSSNGPSLGTVAVTVTAGEASILAASIPVGVTLGGSATTTGDLTITYGYDLVAIPEPMTLALTGSALLGLGLLRRRKRA